ncbi:N-formylglutamate amidohydrolase [Aestuariivirga sp. YIM B02566]|uniref:N-formylglutamate amidohydrolase n=1 Tax=Taklimakanibacter albus TaxID=2800327 RepID=A0ACC5R5F0_9HYPH|nr:N-formylglutamate amidohydrolase [Aestuariivirga sp. YIM B02566]MBK1867839.1 N-formylglutamate amidohydrolase [Aestuariivirga sp. YIM B02566]
MFETSLNDSFARIDGNLKRGLILLADHARNTIPPEYGALGLPPEQFERHIAYDIGVEAVTRGLARALDCPALMATYSRLLIDPNRGADDPTLIMRVSDGAIVPGNALVDDAERERRIARFHRPYHGAITAEIERAKALGVDPVLVSLHSFTPFWKGIARPWHVGVLWDTDRRFAGHLLAAFRAAGDLCVGDNEPYSGALVGDTLYTHGTSRDLQHGLIEIRQDLIARQSGVDEWISRLAPILEAYMKGGS